MVKAAALMHRDAKGLSCVGRHSPYRRRGSEPKRGATPRLRLSGDMTRQGLNQQ